ncbi:hypothetical protein I3F58_23490 [Streptomyces sp. MUM 203J]|uniref:hypothetical protein n=1 Tax=Streptomyces sp. MUM 203J TaxID=2791990 RepID=UPI001F04FA0C|nr:hypothetical protein [Streptomyces sp. MUM 203J]MCH0542462.1 hypothetical protein [Streptomyces sp. MUM 203J]
MDVTGLALRATAARPRVLLAAVPCGTAARLAAERLLRLRDWPQVSTPAQADLLLVTGPDCPELLVALERLWRDLPAPRARVHARDADGVETALAAGRALLRSPAARRGLAVPRAEGGGERHAGGPDRDPAQGGGPGGGRGGDGDRPGHGGHGDMGTPGGLPMAERGEDRDGLTLDRLHVPLGPFLADWPAGLTIRLVLQGDVVQRAGLGKPAAPAAGAAAGPFWAEPWLRASNGEPVRVGEAARRRAAARLDSLGRLLAVVGWPAEEVSARRLRDDLLSGAPHAAVAARLERWARRVGRSRTLAWLTRGIGVVTAEDARGAGASGPAARADGDVTARYRQWLVDVRHDLRRMDDSAPLDVSAEESPRGRWSAGNPPSAALASLLPGLLEGAELAAARLIVASLDPDPDELAVPAVEMTHG